jgi:cell division septum initiation protein DivIVA
MMLRMSKDPAAMSESTIERLEQHLDRIVVLTQEARRLVRQANGSGNIHEFLDAAAGEADVIAARARWFTTDVRAENKESKARAKQARGGGGAIARRRR